MSSSRASFEWSSPNNTTASSCCCSITTYRKRSITPSWLIAYGRLPSFLESMEAAVDKAYEIELEPGYFLVAECIRPEEREPAVFHSRVA